jgi:4-hydroxy-4-methyl-2-oxoglutarate aldolase
MTKPHDPRAEMLAAICQNASTALLSDIMDRNGRRNNVMHHRLRPLLPSTTIAGWARTVRWIDVDEMEERPYDVEIAVIDSLRPHDVVVHAQDIALRNAPWGELMSTAATVRKAAGCICDSCIRDVRMTKEMKFPIWYTAIKPLDSCGRGRVTAYDVPVVCGDVLVHPGDLIVADDDGVICVPGDMVDLIVPKALAKGQTESKTREGLKKGRTLKEMYDEYGVM